MKLVRAISSALLLSAMILPPDPAHAQARTVEAGDLVRLDRLDDGRFRRALTGRVHSITIDTLFVRARRGDSIVAFGRDRIDGDLRLNLHTGTHAWKGAAVVGGALGSLGFAFGYCFQLFSEECAEDLEAGLQVGAVLGLGGAVVGGLVGAVLQRYTLVNESSLDAGPRITPLVSSTGRLGLSVALPLAAR